MATTITLRKPKSTASHQRRKTLRLRAQNKKLLRWLDTWLATPDDRGEAWWAEFEAEVQNRAVALRPAEAG